VQQYSKITFLILLFSICAKQGRREVKKSPVQITICHPHAKAKKGPQTIFFHPHVFMGPSSGHVPPRRRHFADAAAADHN